MQEKNETFLYYSCHSIDELSDADAQLLNKAREATQNAYAPYSNFFVGAAARFMNGEIITATNQENASFPAGICAERVLLSAAVTMHPATAVETIAISYNNKKGSSETPVSPCGICRQSLLEYEARYNQPIKLILSGLKGNVFVIPQAGALLPLHFSAQDIL